MEAFPQKSWLAGVRMRLAKSEFGSFDTDEGQQQKLGILSFEAAKIMMRLISLYRSITLPELAKLRSSTLRSQGVAYLISADDAHLLRVACAELVDDLDHAAASIARLGERCRVSWSRGFDLIYNDLKSGYGTDFAIGFLYKDLEKKAKKMEGYLSATSALHREMKALTDLENKMRKILGYVSDASALLAADLEALADIEASEWNLERWRNYSGLPPAVTGNSEADPPRADLLMKKLAAQRRVVRKLKEGSIWGRSYEKIADLMSRFVITLFARICTIFSLIVAELPLMDFLCDGQYRIAAGSAFFLRPNFPKEKVKSWTVNYLDAPEGTVGEVGLALRYADVIVRAEEMFSPESAGKDARDKLYQMLPNALRAKLRQSRRVDEEARYDEKMAVEWKKAAGRILQWLVPMAHDTMRWHAERSCERQRMEPAPKVLLLQTLHLADREKAEAAIVEVLVGLSRTWRTEIGRRFMSSTMDEEESSDTLPDSIPSFSDRSTYSYRSYRHSPCCEWEEFPSFSWRSTSTRTQSDILSRSNSGAQKWPHDILAVELQELSTTREEVLTKFDLEMSKGMSNLYQTHSVHSWRLSDVDLIKK